LATQGELLPGTDAEAVLYNEKYICGPVINSRGQVIFSRSSQMWFSDGSQWREVTQDDVPRWNSIALNDNGIIGASHGVAVALGRPGELKFPARKFEPAPGIEPPVSFGEFAGVYFNNSDQLIFSNKLMVDERQYAEHSYSIWVASAGGAQLVVRQGDQIEVAPGDVRTVKTIWCDFPSANDQGHRKFNDKGQLFLKLTFEPIMGVRDKTTGLFIATITSSPKQS